MHRLRKQRVHRRRPQKSRLSRSIGACQQHTLFRIQSVRYSLLQQRMIQPVRPQEKFFPGLLPQSGHPPAVPQTLSERTDSHLTLKLSHHGNQPVYLSHMPLQVMQRLVETNQIHIKQHPQIVWQNLQRIAAPLSASRHQIRAFHKSAQTFAGFPDRRKLILNPADFRLSQFLPAL